MRVLAFGVVVWLIVIGLYGVVTSRNLIHLVVCLSVAQSATDVLILEIGYVKNGTPPCSSACPHTRGRPSTP